MNNRSYDIAYRQTKNAIQNGTLVSARQMYYDILEQNVFIWRNDADINAGIQTAIAKR